MSGTISSIYKVVTTNFIYKFHTWNSKFIVLDIVKWWLVSHVSFHRHLTHNYVKTWYTGSRSRFKHPMGNYILRTQYTSQPHPPAPPQLGAGAKEYFKIRWGRWKGMEGEDLDLAEWSIKRHPVAGQFYLH